MRNVLRPLIPLLLLAPLIATNALHAATPLASAPFGFDVRAPAQAPRPAVVPAERAAQARLLLASTHVCVRSGNRMVC